ncbi:conserved hypothetical protein [Trichinella spiralis]|uniref:hypothetical protein n=1 Tax=Trichinella spiralis TaxID=6334 RepID=UPI0001EFE8EF|nr:conserved hypothetical protein [Trichinella spiralis]
MGGVGNSARLVQGCANRWPQSRADDSSSYCTQFLAVLSPLLLVLHAMGTGQGKVRPDNKIRRDKVVDVTTGQCFLVPSWNLVPTFYCKLLNASQYPTVQAVCKKKKR